MALHSKIIIASDIAAALEALRNEVQTERYIEITRIGEKESFKVEDAKLAVEKAYIADEAIKIIVLAADQFSVVVQNKLLKILEEPPPKTEFILVTTSKASLLPTVRSRLPLELFGEAEQDEALELNIETLTLKDVYTFLQEHKRDDAQTMRKTVELLAKAAIRSSHYEKDEATLQLFERAVIALDSGSPPPFVLNAVLLKMLAKKKR
jgi:DNA polymerase-3 subunit delta'